jgi:hypothetical protein
MAKLNYVKHELIRLKGHPDYTEKWLQDKIEADPSILGLGDLVVLKREREQSSGGRIDFLLKNTESDTMYEVEIMLGATDEKHIIRTIEYWDIERRHFLEWDHKAIIVAEEITNRFFNVIALMNRSIPLIAIQLNALKIDDKLVLNFTKVLDIYEEQGDERILDGEVKDRNYWEALVNTKFLEVFDEIGEIFKRFNSEIRISYHKWDIAIGTQRRNIFWFHHRKREGYFHFGILVGENNVEKAKEISDNHSIVFTLKRNNELTIGVTMEDFKMKKEALSQIFELAVQAYT